VTFIYCISFQGTKRGWFPKGSQNQCLRNLLGVYSTHVVKELTIAILEVVAALPLRTVKPSGVLRPEDWKVVKEVSEASTAFFFRAKQDEGSTLLTNSSNHSTVDTTQHAGRLETSSPPLCESERLHVLRSLCPFIKHTRELNSRQQQGFVSLSLHQYLFGVYSVCYTDASGILQPGGSSRDTKPTTCINLLAR
jgi:hypothetical protein